MGRKLVYCVYFVKNSDRVDLNASQKCRRASASISQRRLSEDSSGYSWPQSVLPTLSFQHNFAKYYERCREFKKQPRAWVIMLPWDVITSMALRGDKKANSGYLHFQIPNLDCLSWRRFLWHRGDSFVRLKEKFKLS